MAGFGFFDACDYEPKPDNTAWIIEGILPKESFGFTAGPAKGNASPFGGKSVMQRKLALCVITGEDFFGHKVLEKGRVMFVNLDENQDKQVRLYYRMTKGKKVSGYLISRANSCKLPEQIHMLEEDIRDAKPLIVIIDPFQRTLGGRDAKQQKDVGPIIDELKRLSKTYSCTIIVNHHSNKDAERDKETTGSWLSGSNDLDAAWDFCFCLEYNKKNNWMHLRNFQKEKAKTDIYYEAEIINGDEIIGLFQVPAEIESKQARELIRFVINHPHKSVSWVSQNMPINRASVYKQMAKCLLVKNTVRQYCSNPDEIEENTVSSES